MRTRIHFALSLSFALGLLAPFTASAQIGGGFYGLLWDGGQEHFITVDPYTGQHQSVAVLPDVRYVDATFRIFDPDSGRFIFVGGTTTADTYRVVDVATGVVTSTMPREDNLKNPVYDHSSGRIYGTWWSDSTVRETDSLGLPGLILPHNLRGTEYFASIDARNGARTDTPIPGLKYLTAGGPFFDTDSGRYVLHGTDTAGVSGYYVIDVATGELLARVPLSFRLDFPVYNPVLGAVHGLWWSDSTVREFDSLGRPKPLLPPQINGTEYFVTIHADSSIDLVELPGVKWISNFNRALDVDSQRYVFTGKAATGPMRYYVVDVATGTILSDAEAAGNIKHLVYAPMGTTYYPPGPVSLRNVPTTKGWKLRPVRNAVELSFENPDRVPHRFTLHDASGRIITSRDRIVEDRVRIESNRLRKGMYLFRLHGPGGDVASGRIVLH